MSSRNRITDDCIFRISESASLTALATSTACVPTRPDPPLARGEISGVPSNASRDRTHAALAHHVTRPTACEPATVGMPAKIEQLVLPGTELEATPIEDRRSPLVLRIADVLSARVGVSL